MGKKCFRQPQIIYYPPQQFFQLPQQQINCVPTRQVRPQYQCQTSVHVQTQAPSCAAPRDSFIPNKAEAVVLSNAKYLDEVTELSPKEFDSSLTKNTYDNLRFFETTHKGETYLVLHDQRPGTDPHRSVMVINKNDTKKQSIFTHGFTGWHVATEALKQKIDQMKPKTLAAEKPVEESKPVMEKPSSEPKPESTTTEKPAPKIEEEFIPSFKREKYSDYNLTTVSVLGGMNLDKDRIKKSTFNEETNSLDLIYPATFGEEELADLKIGALKISYKDPGTIAIRASYDTDEDSALKSATSAEEFVIDPSSEDKYHTFSDEKRNITELGLKTLEALKESNDPIVKESINHILEKFNENKPIEATVADENEIPTTVTFAPESENMTAPKATSSVIPTLESLVIPGTVGLGNISKMIPAGVKAVDDLNKDFKTQLKNEINETAKSMLLQGVDFAIDAIEFGKTVKTSVREFMKGAKEIAPPAAEPKVASSTPEDKPEPPPLPMNVVDESPKPAVPENDAPVEVTFAKEPPKPISQEEAEWFGNKLNEGINFVENFGNKLQAFADEQQKKTDLAHNNAENAVNNLITEERQQEKNNNFDKMWNQAEAEVSQKSTKAIPPKPTTAPVKVQTSKKSAEEVVPTNTTETKKEIFSQLQNLNDEQISKLSPIRISSSIKTIQANGSTFLINTNDDSLGLAYGTKDQNFVALRFSYNKDKATVMLQSAKAKTKEDAWEGILKDPAPNNATRLLKLVDGKSEYLHPNAHGLIKILEGQGTEVSNGLNKVLNQAQ